MRFYQFLRNKQNQELNEDDLCVTGGYLTSGKEHKDTGTHVPCVKTLYPH